MPINPTTTTSRRQVGRLGLPWPTAAAALTDTRLQLALLFCAGLALRLYNLGAQSLWLDEGSTWAEVTGRTGKGWATLLLELFSPNAAYPLYHILLRAWIALAGDSEWALRFPSALAGALAVPALALATYELRLSASRQQTADKQAASGLPVYAALLLLASPFALWYAQEVKTYSLLLLMTTLQLWGLLRALRLNSRQAWLLYLGLALLSFFTHRLALLSLAGGALAYLILWPRPRPRPWQRLGLAVGVALLAGLASWGTYAAIGSESATSGGHIPAGPLTALWLTLGRLSLDRSAGSLAGFIGLPGSGPLPTFSGWLEWLRADLTALLGSEALARPEFPRVWLLPTLLLFAWGALCLTRAARRGERAAVALLCSGAAPLLLFSLSTALTRLYEPRYMMVVFPAWLLTLAYPALHVTRSDRRSAVQRALFVLLLSLVLLTHAAALLQPVKGLFSGDPVKEQWRQAIGELARRAQPDDLVILQPYYVRPLWDYYAPRVTADPLPQPVIFPVFGEGYLNQVPDPERVRREYEPFFEQVAHGKARALLLIAPEHARTVDPPLTLEQLREKARRERWDTIPATPDIYGWLGLRFAWPQRTWPCGGERYIGVHLMCQSYPEAFGTGAVPQPTTRSSAVFGQQLRLRGFTLKPTTPDGSFRPGGTLALTLYWEATQPPVADYTMFLHLCRECDAPPAASSDAPPLFGYPPAGQTSTWRVGDPVHDERALSLPADLPPGRYSLLLGVYPLGNPAINARLSVGGTSALPDGRILLAQVDVR